MSVQVHSCTGGTSVSDDINKLDAGVQIVSGTPGRVFGMFFLVLCLFVCFFVIYIIVYLYRYD